MQFHPDEARLKFVHLIVSRELNKVGSQCITDCDAYFDKVASKAQMSKEEDEVSMSRGPVRSPSKSPVDPRFATKKVKVKNMFTGLSPSHRTRNAKHRQLGFT
ncbi:hypothetical protein TorRG33x02_077400 [Trema orientale]|uniref:Uncharacterized protein n=1 Tax=Trema orientale TaxID=63057 RepID=A0A2P5FFA4_TREOI|nr:hypothetical protein TorRG33x02_077400 [Trema orientale]